MEEHFINTDDLKNNSQLRDTLVYNMTMEELVRMRKGVAEFLFAVQRTLSSFPDYEEEVFMNLYLSMVKTVNVAADYYVLYSKVIKIKKNFDELDKTNKSDWMMV